MLAEIAFGKYTGTYFDTDVNPKKLPPHDCILPDGRRVDVKSTPYRNGKLTVPPGKQRPDGVDLYALMVGKNDTWRFAGMATADELWNDDNLGQLKKDGPVSHILGQKDLAPLVIYGKIYPIEDEEWTI